MQDPSPALLLALQAGYTAADLHKLVDKAVENFTKAAPSPSPAPHDHAEQTVSQPATIQSAAMTAWAGLPRDASIHHLSAPPPMTTWTGTHQQMSLRTPAAVPGLPEGTLINEAFPAVAADQTSVPVPAIVGEPSNMLVPGPRGEEGLQSNPPAGWATAGNGSEMVAQHIPADSLWESDAPEHEPRGQSEAQHAAAERAAEGQSALAHQLNSADAKPPGLLNGMTPHMNGHAARDPHARPPGESALSDELGIAEAMRRGRDDVLGPEEEYRGRFWYQRSRFLSCCRVCIRSIIVGTFQIVVMIVTSEA